MKLTDIANGAVLYSDRLVSLSKTDWIDHPAFPGVRLKHMITSADTGGIFSSHLVEIDPHCCLESHCHKEQVELHEVMDGKGECLLINKSVRYQSGTMAVINKGEVHRVQAHEQGLLLFAKFFPASV